MKFFLRLIFLFLPLTLFAQSSEPSRDGAYQRAVANLQQEMDRNIEEISNAAVLVGQARDESDLERLKLLVRSIGEKIRVINERKRVVEEEYRLILELASLEKEAGELVRVKERVREEVRRLPEPVTPEVLEEARVDWEMARSHREFERLQAQEIGTEGEILKTETEENEIAREQLRQELEELPGSDWERQARQNEFFALEQKLLLLQAKRDLIDLRKELLEAKDRTNQLSVELKEMRLASLKEKAARQRGEEAFARFEEAEQRVQGEIQQLEGESDRLRDLRIDPGLKSLLLELNRERVQRLRLELSLQRLEVAGARMEEKVESPLVRPTNLETILAKEKKGLAALEAEASLIEQRRNYYELKKRKLDEEMIYRTESGPAGTIAVPPEGVVRQAGITGEIIDHLRREGELSQRKLESQRRLLGLVEEKIASWGGTRLGYRHRYHFDVGMFVPLVRNARSLPARLPAEVSKARPVRLRVGGTAISQALVLGGWGIAFVVLAGIALWFRRSARRRVEALRAKAEGDYAVVLAISVVRLVGRNLVWLVIAAAFTSAHLLLGVSSLIGLPVLSLVGMGIGYLVAKSVVGELFDPRGKVHRLLPLDEGASLFLYRWLHLTLLLMIVPLLLFFLLRVIGAPEAVKDLSWLVVKLGLATAATVALFVKKRVLAFPHPEGGLGRFFYRLVSFVYFPLVLGSVVLLGLSLIGYHNFARFVFVKVGWVLLTLTLVFVVRRILAEQIRRHLSAEGAGQLAKGLISFLNLVVAVAGLGLLFHLVGFELRSSWSGRLWSLLTQSWATVGGTPLTILSLAKALVVFLLFFFLSRIVRGFLDEKIYPKFSVDEGVRSLINTFVHYGLLFFGALAFLSVLGIRLTTLAVFAGAIGVGVGFGLQNIANNFISGLILLFERPVKKGDFVQVGNQFGVIQKIGGRSTMVTTRDNVCIIVPNSEFIAMSVSNWSHRDPRTRMKVPVGVAYGTDVELVDRVLREVAGQARQVLKSPPPEVLFKEFGESSLNFDLMVWVDNPLTIAVAHDELNRLIDKKFRELGIEIPFPQRDLHFRTGLDILKPT